METRAWYRHQRQQRGRQGDDLDHFAAAFDEFAQPSEPFIDPALVRQDMTALEAVISRVNTYTSKTLAHRDDDVMHGVPARGVSWGELDAAIDAVGEIHKKYYRLRHSGVMLGALTPVISPGWTQMFATAWASPRFTPPDDLSFEPRAAG